MGWEWGPVAAYPAAGLSLTCEPQGDVIDYKTRHLRAQDTCPENHGASQ